MNKPVAREGFVEGDPVEADVSVTYGKAKPTAAIEKPAATPPPDDEVQEDVAALPEWPVVIKLMHKPIRTPDGNEVHDLIFREPTAMDIIRVGGNPCRIEIIELTGGMATFQPLIDDRKMMAMMAQLSGVAEMLLQKMDPRDYNSCAHKLRRFFLPEQGLW